MSEHLRPLEWTGNGIRIIDQTRLPGDLVFVDLRTVDGLVDAIVRLAIRGAPALGAVGALGVGLAMLQAEADGWDGDRRAAEIRRIRDARPTAVNLAWAVDQVTALVPRGLDAVVEAANGIFDDDARRNRLIATHGADWILAHVERRPLRILTHCNTGPLACGQFGTALGVVQVAHNEERPIHVWVGETRPYLQGARLTTWELAQAGVPHTLIPDVAAGHLMARGEVDVILVGADRVAANGDTANKVGTYPLAVLAARHDVPFYVCAPTSSVDLATPDGAAIPIEERKADEVLSFRGVRIAPPDTDVRNPSFDITPAELITGIVTEEGVIRGPYQAGLAAAVASSRARHAAAPSPFAAAPARGIPALPHVRPEDIV